MKSGLVLISILTAAWALGESEVAVASDADSKITLGQKNRRGGGGRDWAKKRPLHLDASIDSIIEDGDTRKQRQRSNPGGQQDAPSGQKSSALLTRRLAEAEGPVLTYPLGGELPELSPLPSHADHRTSENAIFGAFFSPMIMGAGLKAIVGTARHHYKGDIVIAILPGERPHILKMFKDFDVILYEIELDCVNASKMPSKSGDMCRFHNVPGMDLLPVAQIRYYLYWQWAKKYSLGSKLMLADTRDVFFQSNPFEYMKVGP